MLKSIFGNKRSLKVGFTLIELLVVIAIIGVLASIVLASLNTARKKSRDARRISDIKQIQLALELCFDAGNGCGANTSTEYPNEDTGNTVPAALKSEGYIPQIPVDPSTAAVYTYLNLVSSAGTGCDADTATCNYYQMGAVLEDVDNPALDSDADINLSGAGGLDGDDSNCDTVAATGADQCFDVAP